MESPSSDIIIKQNTRILMPSEYEKLRRAMITPENQRYLDDAVQAHDWTRANYHQRYQIVSDAMLLTGMRYVEFANMQRAWYSGPRRVIQMPKDAHGKKRCQFIERTVMLSLPGCDALERYFQSGIPCIERHTMNWSLKYYAGKAGIGTDGISVKMFRKTFVSWLMACYPEQVAVIAATMGHTINVMQRHYLALGFPTEELRKMRDTYLVEWGKRL